jgi:preprotein translocase subunit SecF
MFIVKYRTFFYTLSAILVVGSIVAMLAWGLHLSIDFKGGSLLEVSYPGNNRPSQSAVQSAIVPLNIPASVIPSGTNEYDIRTATLNDTQKNAIISALSQLAPTSSPRVISSATSSASSVASNSSGMQVVGFNTIGPVLGAEAAWKSITAVIFVLIAIILFITWAFRKVSRPVASWKYGIVAVIALFHDVIIPTGVFALLGHTAGYEVDTLFVTAVLVVLGFSVHDTIVVFDRIRENLRNSNESRPFADIVGASINQTFVRSINTSLTTIFALVVLYFVGGASTQHFALALIVGIASGTYSSIFIGSTLLVTLEKWQKKKGKK